uniref:Uncharacterized protein n=1 Tax=Oryza sativa subsp. japonica TaxID=39947 RepID=Q6L4I1_ORYSJ|nr:hypothetical protein [Oryza sativa Japonica Group]
MSTDDNINGAAEGDVDNGDGGGGAGNSSINRGNSTSYSSGEPFSGFTFVAASRGGKENEG